MIDARGYSCPMPVVMVRQAVKEKGPDTLEVLVDNRCAVENIKRFGNNQGYAVDVTPREEDFFLVLTKK